MSFRELVSAAAATAAHLKSLCSPVQLLTLILNFSGIQKDENGKQLLTEVAVMQVVSDGRDELVGATTPVSLLDFYDLRDFLILVIESPSPSESLSSYRNRKQGVTSKEVFFHGVFHSSLCFPVFRRLL